ncbi:MAG: altronate dehydratase family protein [Clostridiaceae bacterium]|nr:altronate dehydratase family protein [Clostridiaceae bacterium]
MLTISPRDNVAVELTDTPDVPAGHKRALADLPAGARVIKYGFPIGRAAKFIPRGTHVHMHNLESMLEGVGEYAYHPDIPAVTPRTPAMFDGYRLPDGRCGTRSEIWILPMVGCVNAVCRTLAAHGQSLVHDGLEGVYTFEHPYGCSQLGGDLLSTRRILAGLAQNPNAAGVLIVALGCENNTLDAFWPLLPEDLNIRFLVTQDVTDEIEEGLRLLRELAEPVYGRRRESCPVSALTVGLKCGGSDGFSGITANPLLGRFTDTLVAMGGGAMLTEVSEMFGAEETILSRCVSEKVYGDAVHMLTAYREYLIAAGEPIYDNPSPGNHAGGITTLEEKSLGCTTKAGCVPIVEVVPYGECMRERGLALLESPSNDIVACTALAAAGAQLILFTTGRGTPMGSPVPVVKVASNTRLALAKPGWIDFDAGSGTEQAADGAFLSYVLRAASGERVSAERRGNREFAIWKRGVTM